MVTNDIAPNMCWHLCNYDDETPVRVNTCQKYGDREMTQELLMKLQYDLVHTSSLKMLNVFEYI